MSGKGKLRREGKCRLCGASAALKKLTIHHLIPQSHFRHGRLMRPPDRRTHLIGLTPNLIPLCERCHRLVESKEASGGLVHRSRLRACLTAREVRFAREHGGADWFDARYPLALADPRDEAWAFSLRMLETT